MQEIKPQDCRSYNEYKKRSGLSNKEASSDWMQFKLDQWNQNAKKSLTKDEEKVELKHN